MPIPDAVANCLEVYLDRYDSEHIVQLGPPSCLAAWPDRVFIRRKLTRNFNPDRDLADLGRLELALVLDAPTVLTKISTRQLLARLRDYSARAIIAAFDIDAAHQANHWSVAEFLGLGFRRVPEARKLSARYWIYRYDIHDYKITPDWLNSRHWANPEQWGRHRW